MVWWSSFVAQSYRLTTANCCRNDQPTDHHSSSTTNRGGGGGRGIEWLIVMGAWVAHRISSPTFLICVSHSGFPHLESEHRARARAPQEKHTSRRQTNNSMPPPTTILSHPIARTFFERLPALICTQALTTCSAHMRMSLSEPSALRSNAQKLGNVPFPRNNHPPKSLRRNVN
jgi:hypothetical protein